MTTMISRKISHPRKRDPRSGPRADDGFQTSTGCFSVPWDNENCNILQDPSMKF